MNKKGFTLIELLASLALLGLVLCIGLYATKSTLSTSLSTLKGVSKNEIYDASKIYVLENNVAWMEGIDVDYVCFNVNELVDKGYFDKLEVSEYENDLIKVVRTSKTKTIESIKLVDDCQ